MMDTLSLILGVAIGTVLGLVVFAGCLELYTRREERRRREATRREDQDRC